MDNKKNLESLIFVNVDNVKGEIMDERQRDKCKYEKLLQFIEELADHSVYERFENINEINWEATELLKEIEKL